MRPIEAVVATTAVTLAGAVSPSIRDISPKYSPSLWKERMVSLPLGSVREAFTRPFFTTYIVLSGVFFHEDDFIPLVLPFFEHLRDGLQF